MIRYALRCGRGHAFESWFRGAEAFDDQAARGLLACPTCDSADVTKAIMAPAILGHRRGEGVEAGASSAASAPAAAAPVGLVSSPANSSPPASAAPATPAAMLDDDRRALVRAVLAKVVSETRDVGRAFPDEARRIHDSGSDERVRGEATPEEALELLEDGIMVMPLPSRPDDLN